MSKRRDFPPELRDKFLQALASAEIKNLVDIAEVTLECVGYFDMVDSQKFQAMRAVVDAAIKLKNTEGEDRFGVAERKLFEAISQWEKLHCKFYQNGVCSEGTCGGTDICCFDCGDRRKCEDPCPTPCPSEVI